MAPTVDLRAILGPIVETVAGLVFPDSVAIEAAVDTQDDAGDTVRTWVAWAEGVPALIAPITAREQSVSPVPVSMTDVSILLSGDRAVLPSYRIRSEYAAPQDLASSDPRPPDVWDVVGVARDEARVTTTVYGRRVTPGVPNEAGS